MANTSVSPNNKSVTFRGKPEREMSTHERMNAQAQSVDGGAGMTKPASPAKTSSWNNRGIANSEQTKGAPAGVENTAPMKMTKKPSKSARKRAKGAVKHGMISEKAAKKHLGGY